METFLLRVWRSADPDEPTLRSLNGVLLHVATGWERAFRSSEDLVEFLASWPCSAPVKRRAAELHEARAQRASVATTQIEPHAQRSDSG